LGRYGVDRRHAAVSSHNTLGNLLRADKTSVFTGLAGAYLGALLIIPLIGLGFFKYIHLNYWTIILLILELILLPLALSG